ncbi:MAG: MSEP-CTERM sorting domain-containing protein [Opitutae bacterium]|nr:MSEP-CTERM sorting domain-containing protein [Opitutae bacterium]
MNDPIVKDPAGGNPLKNEHLLPVFTRQASFLPWVWALPIAVLLAYNLFYFSVLGGDFEDSERTDFFQLLGLNIGNLALALGAFVFCRKKPGEMPSLLGLAVLAIQILHLWLGILSMEQLPGGGVDWFMPSQNILIYQFTFCMIPAIYGLIHFAGVRLSMNLPSQVGLSLLICIGVPVVLKIILSLSFINPTSVPKLVFITLSVLFLVGLCRLLLLCLKWLFSNPYVTILGKALFVLVLPIAGLLLNKNIPFPVDFQIVDLYILTVFNGVLLCIPSPKNASLNRILFALKCVSLPFSIYFFLVFLPWMPLAIFAVVLAGSGFLMLSPTLLFLIHVHDLTQGFRKLFPEGAKAKKIQTGVLVLLLPVWYTAQAFIDRQFLHEGIQHVISPDLEETSQFAGSRGLTLRSIERLADYKNGKYLPFISELYAKIVFDNLTLPDSKMQRIYTAFRGEAWDPNQSGNNIGPWSRSNRDTWGAPRQQTFDRNVEMKIPEINQKIDGDLVRTRAVLKLKNLGQDQNEFVTKIRVPEGVFLSGYWLHVGEERVPGRLFEKKTALWVYQNIRDFERRDPGLVYYVTPTELTLRVFPLASGETRTTEIEFLYPKELKPRISIGDEVLDLGESNELPRIHIAETGAGAMVVVPKALRTTLPVTIRSPYIHFNLDRSNASKEQVEKTLAEIQKTARFFPEVQDFTISLANFDYQELVLNPSPWEDLPMKITGPQLNTLSARGGFLQTQSEARTLHRYRSKFLDAGEAGDALRVPIMWNIQHHESPVTENLSLNELLSRYTPDYPKRGISGILLFRKGRIVRPLALEHETDLAAHFPESNPQVPLEIYNPDSNEWETIPDVHAHGSETLYAQAANLYMHSTTAILNPRERTRQQRSIVQQSKKLNILSRLTSFIVVENHAQWKALELTEKKKLGQNAELELQEEDFMENPEPPLWLLATLMLTVGWCFCRHRHHKTT